MNRKLCAFAIAGCLVLVAAFATAADNEAVGQATSAADSWLTLVDAGQYRQSWDSAASIFKQHVSAQAWESQVGAVRKPLGSVLSRKVASATYATSLPGAPDGEYVVIRYNTSFENKKSATETVTPMNDNGQWRVSGYFIR
jgi:hypothetical protein